MHHNINIQHAEKMRVRELRAMAARAEAEIERDRALELTLEVLRRRQANKRRGMGRAQSAPGVKLTAHFQVSWSLASNRSPPVCLTIAFDEPKGST